METKINVKDADKLQKALDEVQKNCRARLLDIEDILYAARRAEATLENLAIPKKAWRGCRVVIEPERVTNNYDGRADGTGVTIERTATGWYVVSLGREQCRRKAYGGNGTEARLVLTKEAKSALPDVWHL
jgi:hypothetical protein